MNIFKPEDFEGSIMRQYPGEMHFAGACAAQANKCLAEIVKDWPLVYGRKYEDGDLIFSTKEEKQGKYDSATPDTHTARLAFVEEIKPNECDFHEVEIIHRSGWNNTELFVYNSICKKCGKKLKAKWEAID